MNQLSRLSTYVGISVLAVLTFLSLPHNTTHINAEDTLVLETHQNPVNHFKDIEIKAKAAFVYDLSKNESLFAKNEQQALPLASLAKIMTAITASDLAPETTLVNINSERWTLGKLLQYTLVASSNDGADAVASALGSLAKQNPNQDSHAAFIEKMNDEARNLGFMSMRFNNPSGLDESPTNAGAYGSAKDVALLLGYALNHYRNIIEPTRYPSFQVASVDNLIHSAKNTDTLVTTIPGLILSKTGYTTLAGGNLAIIFDVGVGHPIAVVVLGSSYDGRFTDVKILVEAAVASI